MIRKQIYLSEENERLLKSEAARRKTSEAFLIREALGSYFANQGGSRPHPLDAIVGLTNSGPRDGARNHDHYLYGAPKKRRG